MFAVFLTLELTLIFLAIGNFSSSPGWTQFGGYIGIVTALVAWYTSAAGMAKRLEREAQAPRRQAADLAALQGTPQLLSGRAGLVKSRFRDQARPPGHRGFRGRSPRGIPTRPHQSPRSRLYR